MSEKHTHEEKPWSPTMDRDQLLNPFANPQDGQPQNPVHLMDEEEGESDSEEEAANDAISSDDLAEAPKVAE